MESGRWYSTVKIELGGQSRIYARISSTRGAASYLLDQWPGARDISYKEAVVSCTKALKGEVNDEIAFTSFIHAASISGLRYVSTPEASPDKFEQDIRKALRQSILSDFGAMLVVDRQRD
ncbi:UNVERIFIED_ORG: hypothetical protein J2740_003824 [Rhizobium nepotum]|nr:hypothetical protein [Rhizobium nepotum]